MAAEISLGWGKSAARLLVQFYATLEREYSRISKDNQLPIKTIMDLIRTRDNNIRKVDKVADLIFWTVSEWACRLDKEFSGVSLYALALSWKACLNGGRMKSPVIHSSWLCPPAGLLKMNFDGSFNRESGRGGFGGGVIRASSGRIVRRFSAVVDCSDANGAEAYGMLVGCSEPLQLDAFDAIVEGDSSCAIQWGSAAAMCPWHLTDWVKKFSIFQGNCDVLSCASQS